MQFKIRNTITKDKKTRIHDIRKNEIGTPLTIFFILRSFQIIFISFEGYGYADNFS